MLHKLKKRLYFVVAGYFAFWAKFVLKRWKPRIIVVTGSSGKTTLLHMLEAQLGDKAVYSHHANSAIGIPFYILGFPGNVTSKLAWPIPFIRAPFGVFRKLPKQKLFVVEADCDRPHEGQFLSKLLQPEATLWVSVSRTHSMNFDHLVNNRTFATHELAIAHEFGYFPEATRKLVILASDYPEINEQLPRIPKEVMIESASQKNIKNYRLTTDSTVFNIGMSEFTLPGLHPKEVGISLQMVEGLLTYLGEPLDATYKKLVLPPSRGSVFKGKNNTTLIDSSYNTGLGATKAMLALYTLYPSEHKWAVLGDILEQGSLEQQEHERLAELLPPVGLEHLILFGARTKQYTYPLVQKKLPKLPVVSFETPKEALDYLSEHLQDGETILFKGGRYPEGIIEQLLLNPDDAAKLCRREPFWAKRRQSWGLPH